MSNPLLLKTHGPDGFVGFPQTDSSFGHLRKRFNGLVARWNFFKENVDRESFSLYIGNVF
jgi:hypothetical protein